NVTQAVQDELMGSLDYKLATSNVNYVQSRRDVMYFPSSLSTFTPTTSRVARIPLTSGMDFVDPESVKIAFRVRNTDGAGGQLFPGSFEGSCFIKRVQLFSNGQRTDDISEYGRCCWLYSLLKPQEWYNGRAYEGFYPTNLGNPPAILDGNYKDVLIPPTLIGMFQSGKMLPPQLNLVLEIEFADPADALWPGGDGTTSYSIENVRVLASQVSSIPAGTTQHNVTVARSFTKLMGAFVTFKDDNDALGEVMNLEYPAVNGQLESQMQLGALQYPRYPMASLAEHHHFLEIMAGTYDSKIKSMRLNRLEYEDTQFIAAFPVERVPKHPLSGISTRSGDLARFTFKNLQPDRAQKLYIHLEPIAFSPVGGAGSHGAGIVKFAILADSLVSNVLMDECLITVEIAAAKALTKRKELEVHQLLSGAGLQFESQHYLPFRSCGLESETSRALADFVLYGPRCAIILEVDEGQHSNRDHSCDVRRDFDIAASVALGSDHKLVIVRYNPDAFKVAGQTVRTTKKERHARLLQLLHSLLQEEPERQFQRLFLYYDRAAEDSELPAVAEDWDVVARTVSRATTESTGITAGQLATVLTAYTPQTETAANSASISANSTAAANNAAAVASVQAQVNALPPPPDLTPYALASDLAAAEGQLAANQSSITALNTSLTTGLASKANQSALDALQLEVDSKSTPASVDAKLASYSTTAAMNSAITSANNATLASVASKNALRSVTDQLALDLAAKQSGPDVDQKIATALLDRPSSTDLNAAVGLRTSPADVDQKLATALVTYVTQVALDAALALRDGRLDAAEASITALQAAGFQTAAQVASAIATALLSYTDSVGVNALLAVRDGRLDAAEASITGLQSAGYQTSTQVSAVATALLPYVQQTALDAALGLRDLRLDSAEANILALQGAGPFASAADLDSLETSLQSAIDAVLAQLAVLAAGAVQNAPEWAGQTTFELLVGASTLRRLHVTAPLSISLQNEDQALSIACDSYAAIAAAIAAALAPYETAAQRDAAITAALAAFSNTSEVNGLIAAALTAYSYYSITAEMNSAISAAVAGIDLSPYYSSAQTDAAITAALVPVTLSNAPAWGANPPTWELLKGTNVLRNLHFAGPLSASLQNNTDTLEIDCDSYEKAETYTQAEVNSVVAGAIDVLNVTQYRTEAQVSTAISDALVPYYDASQVDAQIAANSFDSSQYYTRTQSDSRYFLTTANFVGTTLVRTDVTPPTLRTLQPRAPISTNLISSNGTVELLCDAWSKSEADSRYVQSSNLTSLDSRYFPVNGNAGGGGIFPMVITTLTPRMIRAILPRAPLSGAFILGNGATLELNCDCYSKAESDGRYYTMGRSNANFADIAIEADVAALDTRVAALEASPLPADISANSVSATGDWLSLVGGTAGTRIQDNANNDLITVTTTEAFFGIRSRVDHRLTIDTPSGPDEGLYTAAVRALELTGLLTGTEAVFPTRVSTPELAPSLFTGTTGLEVTDQSLNPPQVEDDETKSLSRLISNTAGTGFARLQLDANTATGFEQLEVASAGGCTLNAPGQEI
ncbi:unnamed protein product, partial [Symbiodinium necroappetens]